MTNVNFKEDLKIDQYALDTEWLKQPLLYAKWGEMSVNAASEKDFLKERLEVVLAEIDADIRKYPENYGNPSTERAIKSAITNSKKYQEANSKYLESCRVASLLSVAVTSFEHRKRALTKLTELYISKYYSEPYVSSEAKMVVEKKASEGAQLALQASMENRKLKR